MKRRRSADDGGLIDGSPSAKRRASGKLNTCPDPPQPLEVVELCEEIEPSLRRAQAIQQEDPPPWIGNGDSGIDLSCAHNPGPDPEPPTPKEEPPDCEDTEDWGPVYEGLKEKDRKERKRMDEEARRRRLRNAVTDPTGIRELIDSNQTIQKDNYCPPELHLASEDIARLERDFRTDVLKQLDTLVSELAPNPNDLPNLCEALDGFDVNSEVMERKFAGSKFATMLLPQAKTHVNAPSAKIRLILDHQPNLYRGFQESRLAYIFQSVITTAYLSTARRPDFAYCLSREVCDPETSLAFAQSSNLNHFPCYSATLNSIFPIATGEVKVAGNPYKQRFQQGFYASYYIISWLILRMLAKGAPANTPANEDTDEDPAAKRAAAENAAKELFEGVHHCCFSISPHTLQIWEYRPRLEPIKGNLRIHAQLLCSGAPGDQTFMENIYIPWTRYVLKRGTVSQILHLLPAIRSYAARPWPRPFDHPDTVFVKVSDLKPGSYELGSSSFGNGEKAEQGRLHELVSPYEEAVRLASVGGRKRKGSGSQSQSQSQSTSTSTSLGQVDGFTETEEGSVY